MGATPVTTITSSGPHAALELISLGSDLVELTVEGVRADDAAGMDDALWDGVDAACYYGPDVDTIEDVDLA
jgi:hypothetical protein